ncbi:helix-turn-helix transcriptional regulator [Sulfurovum sp. NBC37-1]|uniref:helix-turn-helix transcriptional regulator n=1 Tax=Sulfurovum sp. (strain NBC37-1) TaxID=387093 RepID=UPI0001587B06|nr:helix-turn-helix domain-containing protein [Sulfurovum sp. NBC37-1]BAF73350.1 phage-related protein [Sulfurovum sp. NBC37-1]
MREEQPRKQNYRAKEAAEYLGVALSTIWLYAKQGRLTPIKLSPRITVFKKDELDNLGITA